MIDEKSKARRVIVSDPRAGFVRLVLLLIVLLVAAIAVIVLFRGCGGPGLGGDSLGPPSEGEAAEGKPSIEIVVRETQYLIDGEVKELSQVKDYVKANYGEESPPVIIRGEKARAFQMEDLKQGLSEMDVPWSQP
ncbi:MAG: hypothetical protein AMXMBFR82_29530 [Candidatus Hydrogenedentota bacterium]